MLKLSVLEFFFRAIPEGFLFVFATYTFTKVVVNKGRYLLSSILLAIIAFTIRQLPINYGVHTIWGLIILIVLNVSINKFEVFESIKAVVFTFVLELICEAINFIIVRYVFKISFSVAFGNVKDKLIYATPSLVIFAVTVFVYYYILLKRKKLRIYL